MFKKIKNKINKKLAVLTLSLSNVEKDSLGQMSSAITVDTNKVKRNADGTLVDDLKQGKISQEVMNLRWRNYRILNHADNFKTEIIGVDENGDNIIKISNIDKSQNLDKIKLDDFDDYNLELCFLNDDITVGVSDAMSVISDGGKTIMKNKKPLEIERSFFPKFDIEQYTVKLNVRKIDEENRLLEFYVSKYPDEYNKTSNLFLKEILKAKNNPLHSNMLEINTVSFVTNNTTIGVNSFLEYKFGITNFDKIVDFNGHYVIKFKAKVLVNGDYTFEKYRQANLDKKYDNKEYRF